MAVEQKEQKEVKYIVPTFLRIHPGAHEEATAIVRSAFHSSGNIDHASVSGSLETCTPDIVSCPAYKKQPAAG
jgi:hypothetical protein